MKKITFTTILIMTMFLVACSNSAQPEETVQPDETAVNEAAQENASDAPTVLVTEDDYRNAIASESDDSRKLELFREFSSSYRMSADEYAEYAALCESAGDTVSQRKALFALYRMDPSEEHGGMMSDMILKITPEDDDKAEGILAGIVESLKNCEADDFSPESVKSIIASDDWKKSFYIDNGTFTSHTVFESDKLSAEVDSDSLETRVVITSEDTRYLFAVSYNRTDVGHVGVKDGNSEGKYYYRQMDGENVDIMSVNGYIENGHYVNQLEVTVGGTLYKGTFDDAGKTKEKQPEGFKGVVYAYSEGGTNYLYVENADPGSFVAKIGEMGFEEF